MAVRGATHGKISCSREENRRRELRQQLFIQRWTHNKLIHIDAGVVAGTRATGAATTSLGLPGRDIGDRQCAEKLGVTRACGPHTGAIDPQDTGRGQASLDEDGRRL